MRRLCNISIVDQHDPVIDLAMFETSGPFYKHGLILIPAWTSNYIHYKMWDAITYPLLNFNGATVEVYEWISNFISHVTRYVITYPCWD